MIGLPSCIALRNFSTWDWSVPSPCKNRLQWIANKTVYINLHNQNLLVPWAILSHVCSYFTQRGILSVLISHHLPVVSKNFFFAVSRHCQEPGDTQRHNFFLGNLGIEISIFSSSLFLKEVKRQREKKAWEKKKTRFSASFKECFKKISPFAGINKRTIR